MSEVTAIPNIDIRPDHWGIVRDILQKWVPQCAVWAFGSRAKWTAKEYSDLDLAIITDKPLSLDISASLADEFSESDLPWKVDIVDWANASASFRDVIERDKVVVQEARGNGVMGFEWQPRVFGDLVEFVAEKAKAKDATSGAYISTENLQPNFGGVVTAATLPKSGSVTKFKAGDTLFSNIRTYFKKVWQAEFDGYCSNDVLVFRTKDEVALHENYLHYLCCWEKFTEFSVRTSKGAKMPRGDKDALSQFQFELPPLEEQLTTAGTLHTLDEKIDTNRRINQTLEAMAQVIFKSWFVDFDPVKAKIAAIEQGEDPLRAAMRVISGKTDAELDQMSREHHNQLAATAALFPDAMQESELGKIPKGWSAATLGRLCATYGGFIQTGPFGSQLHARDYKQQGIPVTMPQDMLGRRIQTDKIARIDPRDAERLAKHRMRTGDIVFSRRGDVGRHALVTSSEQGWLCGTGCLLVRPSTKTSVSSYVSCALDQPDALEWLVRHAVGATMPNLNTGILSDLPMLIPSPDVVAAFEQRAMALTSSVNLGNAQTSVLVQLRDTLLPKLLSGELSVAEIKEKVTP